MMLKSLWKDWTRSISFRLLISAAVFLILVLPLVASLLTSRHRSNLETNFEKRLEAHLSTLIASALRGDDGSIRAPEQMGSDLFELGQTGWGWQVFELDGADKEARLFSSLSLEAEQLPQAGQEDPKTEFGARITKVTSSLGQKLLMVSRSLSIDQTNSSPRRYSFKVTGNFDDITESTNGFKRLLWLIFSLLGLTLLSGSLLQIYFGLKPLRKIRQDLQDIRAGKAAQLEGEFPTEIEPLQMELNRLIDTNHAIVERARTHVGNLAHALKTPLSVIRNEISSNKNQVSEKVEEQLILMTTQIRHHLDRAQIAGRMGQVAGVSNVPEVLSGLQRALTRIYQDKMIEIDLDQLEGLKFHGERQDLEEMVGNLLDNGAKWAKSKVRLTYQPLAETHTQPFFQLSIEDDGPGLNKEQLAQVKARGKRLDETKPGSGLGLSIVSDLAHMYGGTFELCKSDAGGVKASLQLPGGMSKD